MPTAPIIRKCPLCGRRLFRPAETSVKTLRCPGCRTIIRPPEAKDSEPPRRALPTPWH